MNVVFLRAVMVRGVRRNGMGSEFAQDVVDDIRRIVDITHARGGCGAQVGGRR